MFKLLLLLLGFVATAIIRDVKEIPGDLPKDISKFIKIWNSNGGQYIPYSEETWIVW